METGLAAYIAHPDITAIRCERWTPDLKAAYEDILKASPALDIPLEINACGLRKPQEETEEGAPASLSVDALLGACRGIRREDGGRFRRPPPGRCLRQYRRGFLHCGTLPSCALRCRNGAESSSAAEPCARRARFFCLPEKTPACLQSLSRRAILPH